MELRLQPPSPFCFEKDLSSVTSGNLSKEWEKWKKSFMYYYKACQLNLKENDVQVSIFLHIIGDQGRDIYEQFAKEKVTSLEELLQKFNTYFCPRKNLTIERHRFFTRSQHEFESVEQYIYELKKLSTSCEFEGLRDELVKDRLICGIRDNSLRERLLRESDLNLKKALDICSIAEMSREQAAKLQLEKDGEHYLREVKENIIDSYGVHRVRQEEKRRLAQSYTCTCGARGGRSPRAPLMPQRSNEVIQGQTSARRLMYSNRKNDFYSVICTFCGLSHNKFKCPAYGKKCAKCNKPNHFAKMCRVYMMEENTTDQDGETS